MHKVLLRQVVESKSAFYTLEKFCDNIPFEITTGNMIKDNLWNKFKESYMIENIVWDVDRAIKILELEKYTEHPTRTILKDSEMDDFTQNAVSHGWGVSKRFKRQNRSL